MKMELMKIGLITRNRSTFVLIFQRKPKNNIQQFEH